MIVVKERTMDEIVGDIARTRRITEDDVARLRREVWPDGVVDRGEATRIFKLDQACTDKDEAWTHFYVEALTNYFVWQTEPRGYVDGDRAQELMDHILHDGRIDQMSELELLLEVLYEANRAPEELALLALGAVYESVLEPAAAAYGSNRAPGVITAADVAVMRKAVFGAAGLGSITVSRREAEMLFEINEATRGEENDPEWQRFFVQAQANHLMFPRPAPVLPDAETAKRLESLPERADVGGFLRGIGAAFARRDFPSFSEAWREADPTGASRAQAEAEAMEKTTREAIARESIDADEARWLSGRILNDGAIDDNERALLEFIRDNAPKIDPALRPLLEKI